jgi:hypothetical protein
MQVPNCALPHDDAFQPHVHACIIYMICIHTNVYYVCMHKYMCASLEGAVKKIGMACKNSLL